MSLKLLILSLVLTTGATDFCRKVATLTVDPPSTLSVPVGTKVSLKIDGHPEVAQAYFIGRVVTASNLENQRYAVYDPKTNTIYYLVVGNTLLEGKAPLAGEVAGPVTSVEKQKDYTCAGRALFGCLNQVGLDNPQHKVRDLLDDPRIGRTRQLIFQRLEALRENPDSNVQAREMGRILLQAGVEYNSSSKSDAVLKHLEDGGIAILGVTVGPAQFNYQRVAAFSDHADVQTTTEKGPVPFVGGPYHATLALGSFRLEDGTQKIVVLDSLTEKLHVWNAVDLGPALKTSFLIEPKRASAGGLSTSPPAPPKLILTGFD